MKLFVPAKSCCNRQPPPTTNVDDHFTTFLHHKPFQPTSSHQQKHTTMHQAHTNQRRREIWEWELCVCVEGGYVWGCIKGIIIEVVESLKVRWISKIFNHLVAFLLRSNCGMRWWRKKLGWCREKPSIRRWMLWKVGPSPYLLDLSKV